MNVVKFWTPFVDTCCAKSVCAAVPLVVQELPEIYVKKLLPFLADQLENSAHLQFYLRWCTLLLTFHGTVMKQRASSLMAPLQHLQKSILQKQADLGKMCVMQK